MADGDESSEPILNKSAVDHNSTGTQKAIRVAQRQISTASISSKVSVGATSTTILSAQTRRIVAVIVNDSDEAIYINLSGTAVMNEGIRLNASGGVASISGYDGIITGICASGSKNVTVTEL